MPRPRPAPVALSLLLSLFLGACAAPTPATDDPAAPPATVPHFRWSAGEERMELVVPEKGGPWLWAVRLAAGLGSNDVGLDRGQLGTSALVEFRQVGPRLLLVAPNLDWRTSSPEAAARRGVREAFAESVIFGFEIAGREPDGARVVDATAFLVRDAHGIARKLADSGQGDFALDETRSAVVPDSAVRFPDNADVEVLLTFTGERPGSEVRTTAAVAQAVTLRLRHAFLRLPSPAERCDFRPRPFHPRCGFFPATWHDLDAPLDGDPVRRVITRHHLCPDHPIVYYVDRAAPEPVRTALLEGARWWQTAFAAAGFPGGFRVELLPAGADPHDVRFNVIQWVNRSTRGWSYGSTLTDPRDGRILKGHVTLGALRVRQDVRLMEGLLGPYGPDGGKDPRAVAVALDRIRQLAAHEVGHTLGLAHDFAASTEGRASVMDYPAPLVRVDEQGALDVSAAYTSGCGPWDELAIRYGYQRFDDEEAGLADVLAEARARGFRFLSDFDARGADRAHPRANLWDNGADPLASWDRTVLVRRLALDALDGRALPPGTPWSELEDVLVPLYLHHRYELERVTRLIGGRDYGYALRGDEAPELVSTVPPARQRAALARVLDTLRAEFLALSPELLERLLPPPPGYRRDRESFVPGGLLFDAQAAAEASVALTLELLLNPARLARLADQAAEDPGQLGPEELFEELWRTSLAPDPAAPAPLAELRFTAGSLAVDAVAGVALDEGLAPRVRVPCVEALAAWETRLGQADSPRARWLARRIEAFLDGRGEPPARRRVRIPPGSPIGAGEPRCALR